MQPSRRLVISWSAILLSLSLVMAGWGAVNAARPPTGAPLLKNGQPRITDPYHHLSGVVAVPLEQMLRAATGLDDWAGPLTPPVFGPNVDASLNAANSQNETTIAINPDNPQQMIASANDYRCALCPYI